MDGDSGISHDRENPHPFASFGPGHVGRGRLVWNVDPLRAIPIAKRLALARQLRRESTTAERRAWALLRNRRVLGLKFRRQHVLHGFIVDFYCPTLKLVLELDGNAHDGAMRAVYDDARTAWLQSAGYRLIRIRNKDLTREMVEKLVSRFLRTTPEDKSPLSRRGEGDRG
jgi:very-short-patch-repair endonuclease